MDKKLKEALRQNFTPPPSQKREQFIDALPYPKTRFLEVLFAQIAFIRKRVWIGAALLLASAITLADYAQPPASMLSILSALLPVFSLLVITEIHKSTAHNMAEMELACKYNLAKITLMRLSLLGLAGLLLLFVYVLLAKDNDYGAFRNLIYLSVPYLLSTNLSLVVLLRLKSRETGYVCGAVSLGVSVAAIAVHSSYAFLYSANYTMAWVLLLTLLLILLQINLVKFKTSQEELPWNFA